MDWKVLRGSCEGGNAVRNLDMKRHRRPLFPAFEADLVKFIRAHMEDEGENGSVANDVDESQVAEKDDGVSALPVTENKGTGAIGDTADGGQGRPLTEALILEEAQRLKKVHGVSDEMLVLSVGWLARLKHRYCIRLRKPAGRSSKCSLPLHHQLGLVTGGAESMVSWSSSLITPSAPGTQDASKQVMPRQPVTDATTDIASSNVDLLPPSTQQAGNVRLTGDSIQSATLKRTVLCSAQWHQREAANFSTTTAELLRQIPESIRELACSCQGSATCDKLFGGIAGLRVAVVGFGSIVEAFLAAALVGADGFVTCVEASPANVYLAEQAAENFCLTTLGLPSVNIKFIVGEHGGMPRSSSSSCAGGDELKDLQDQTDIAICNCSIQSLEFPVSKNAMLDLAFGLLKVGGELRAADLVSSRRLSSSECEETRLAVEAIVRSKGAARTHESSKQSEQKLLLGAPYIGDLQRLFRALGGDAEVRSVSCNEAEATTMDVAVASLLPSLAAANNVKFRRVTFHVFRLHNVEDPCEDYGQTAVFNGYDSQDKATGGEDLSSSFQLDDNWNFWRGVCTPIDGNTAQILQTSWMQRYFSVSGDCSRHRGPFVASAYSMEGSPVSQQAASAPETAVADQPSSIISPSLIEPLDMINI
ncbi:unnamed protein product [Peronospora effusa]|uniref:HTH CENPB-type domain-containing protein n=1 Tax=Peronospora effusa TaxID=542832 RepID=A0A3M6VBG1_9STRA|nr:hypothetical protein DD238_007313 [Peronospora effusa]CAI5703361.1 unnamed protein product [Peronospora effusa]